MLLRWFYRPDFSNGFVASFLGNDGGCIRIARCRDPLHGLAQRGAVDGQNAIY